MRKAHDPLGNHACAKRMIKGEALDCFPKGNHAALFKSKICCEGKRAVCAFCSTLLLKKEEDKRHSLYRISKVTSIFLLSKNKVKIRTHTKTEFL